MPGRRALLISIFAVLGLCVTALAEESAPEVVISVADQKLMVMRDGKWTQKFKVSTSKFGTGDSYGSYKTPLGKLRVCDKIGGGFSEGTVIKHRCSTGEVLAVNAPGRDPIVTRILWLEGLEAKNEHAKARGIYIHGTVEEAKIGKAVSYGCIRMRSREVVEIFDAVPLGTVVTIQQEPLPRLARWTPSATTAIAAAKPSVEPKAEPKVEPHKQPEPKAASSSHVILGEGHGVVSQREAAELRKKRAGTPHAAASSSAAESMKKSILFADLPEHEEKPKTH